MMHNKLLLVGIGIGIVVGALLTTAVVVLAGNLGSSTMPSTTFSYTLADLYNRLNTGTSGTQSAFTEPVNGPNTATMHTLNDIMAKAPEVDALHGATAPQVLAGTTFWGLTSGAWGPITGTMPAHGAVVLTPTTTSVAITAGYHNGSGVVPGDTDLAAANIKNGVTLFGVTGTLSSAGLPKTGQTTSYVTGDDGDLERGIAPPAPRFTDNSNGTVTDNLTGLIWLKSANCGGTGISWTNAFTFTNSLRDGWTGDGSGGDCGLSDGSTAGQWRVPNVRELQSLIHYGYGSPALSNTAGTGKWTEGNPFTGVQSDYYWTSTTFVNGPSMAFSVMFNTGFHSYYGKTSPYWVWPVRGGQ